MEVNVMKEKAGVYKCWEKGKDPVKVEAGSSEEAREKYEKAPAKGQPKKEDAKPKAPSDDKKDKR
jgi:hypothetical protein